MNKVKHNVYKSQHIIYISSRKTVSMLPGDLCGRRMLIFFDALGGIF